jgi:hypothetical protein
LAASASRATCTGNKSDNQVKRGVANTVL